MLLFRGEACAGTRIRSFSGLINAVTCRRWVMALMACVIWDRIGGGAVDLCFVALLGIVGALLLSTP